jgi:hypothetical protein
MAGGVAGGTQARGMVAGRPRQPEPQTPATLSAKELEMAKGNNAQKKNVKKPKKAKAKGKK